jgi:hypothetical protein
VRQTENSRRHSGLFNQRSSTAPLDSCSWRGRLKRALTFTIANGKIVEAHITADPAELQQLDVAVLSEMGHGQTQTDTD